MVSSATDLFAPKGRTSTDAEAVKDEKDAGFGE